MDHINTLNLYNGIYQLCHNRKKQKRKAKFPEIQLNVEGEGIIMVLKPCHIYLIILSLNKSNLAFLLLKCVLPNYNLKIEYGKCVAIPFPSFGYTKGWVPSWV